MKKIFTILGLISATAFMNAQIVINEIYGAGGGSNAAILYKYDFVELKNIGSTSVTLNGAYLQYASATGNFNGGNSNHALPSITLAPGQTYLLQEGSVGTAGGDLPTPDAIGTINLSGSAGKIALTSNSTAPTSATSSNVLDFLGYGSTANAFEGAAAPPPSNTTSIARVAGDTNNNATDFVAGAPTPKNSTSGSLAVSDVKAAKAGNFVKNTFVKSDEITFGTDVKDVKVYNMFGQVVKSASVQQNGTVNVAELAKGNYIVTGTVNNEPVSQKILKD
ncbi:nuclease [Chryseobacterium shigense]|uniref:LTD domain-containing protein n=1 Tax=Chryseobacterium shigense TaxID=297244 RepID=A0A1N7IQR5_9FLAO|nr:lamin tail domain-containing protein [Chryseobacterium shigense]PQA95616.1 nuclease [Chryseobacterium shigense]SIS39346.1 hypothetical protein SAMN05421639_104401 [Chryseobacterium shigense]